MNNDNTSSPAPPTWQDTKISIANILQKVEQIAQDSPQLVNLETLEEIQRLNKVVEPSYWQEFNIESEEELTRLEKLGLKAQELSSFSKTNSDSNLAQLGTELEILADLVLSIVNGQRITDLVWEIRRQQRTIEVDTPCSISDHHQLFRLLSNDNRGERPTPTIKPSSLAHSL